MKKKSGWQEDLQRFRLFVDRHNRRWADADGFLLAEVEDFCLALMKRSGGQTTWPFTLPHKLAHLPKLARYQLPYARDALIEIKLYRDAEKRGDQKAMRVHILSLATLESHFTKMGASARIGEAVRKGSRLTRKPDRLQRLTERVVAQLWKKLGRKPAASEVLKKLLAYDDSVHPVVDEIDRERETISWYLHEYSLHAKRIVFGTFSNRVTKAYKRVQEKKLFTSIPNS